jgi:hypothetical protein
MVINLRAEVKSLKEENEKIGAIVSSKIEPYGKKLAQLEESVSQLEVKVPTLD